MKVEILEEAVASAREKSGSRAATRPTKAVDSDGRRAGAGHLKTPSVDNAQRGGEPAHSCHQASRHRPTQSHQADRRRASNQRLSRGHSASEPTTECDAGDPQTSLSGDADGEPSASEVRPQAESAARRRDHHARQRHALVQQRMDTAHIGTCETTDRRRNAYDRKKVPFLCIHQERERTLDSSQTPFSVR